MADRSTGRKVAVWLRTHIRAGAWSVSTNKLLRHTIAELSRHIEQSRLLHFQRHFGLPLGVSGPERRWKLGLVLARFPELPPIRSTQRKSLHNSSGHPLPKESKASLRAFSLIMGSVLLIPRCVRNRHPALVPSPCPTRILAFVDFDEGGMRDEGWRRLRSRPHDNIGRLVF